MDNLKSKQHTYLLPTVLGAILLLSGCWGKTLDFRNAEIVHGKIYSNGANSPFSGNVTNIPSNKILSPQAGLVPLIEVLSGLGSEGDLAADKAGISFLQQESYCDVIVDKGVLNGVATCKYSRGDLTKYKLAFSDGVLDGKFERYESDKDNNLTVKANFKSGQLDGTENIYSRTTQKLIHRANWENGVANGKAERFDEESGKLIFRGKLTDGKLDGDIVKYTKDGKILIYRAAFNKGLKNGLEEGFSEDNGKLIYSVQWRNNVQDGPFKQWDTTGNKLIVDKTFKDGVDIAQAPAHLSELTLDQATARIQANTSNLESCVDSWAAAHRKEVGEDAMITADQIGEWENWCKQGKIPTAH